MKHTKRNYRAELGIVIVNTLISFCGLSYEVISKETDIDFQRLIALDNFAGENDSLLEADSGQDIYGEYTSADLDELLPLWYRTFNSLDYQGDNMFWIKSELPLLVAWIEKNIDRRTKKG